jgi:hypothetical protein
MSNLVTPKTRRAAGARIALVLALLVVLTPAPALAVANTGVFQLDGNTAAPWWGSAEDWDNVYRSVTGKGSARSSSALVQLFTSDGGEPDYTTFGMSNKDSQRTSDWRCNSDNNPQSKTNVLSAFAAAYSIEDRLHLFFGADRESSKGEANFGFWLFQAPVNCVPADKGGTGRFTGHKTHGDVFVVSEFTNGGKIAAVKVYRWTDPDRVPDNGDECLGDGVDCSAAHSGQDHPYATGVDCRADPKAQHPHLCATVNTTGFTSAWRKCTSVNELFEGGLDLTSLFGTTGSCFASFMVETRSSAQFNADLKDFVIGSLGTCGELTIRKKAVGGDEHFDFDVTAGLLTPDVFTLSNGGARTWAGVKPGSYAVKELAAPSGWSLTDLKCATSGGDTRATANLATGTASITMGLAGTVDCTFTNSRLPKLTVVKQVHNHHGGTLTSGDFTLKVDGVPVTSGVANGFPAGLHVVSEGPLPAGYVQWSIGGDCDASGKVTLKAGDSKTCTIKNKDIGPQLKVIKKVINTNGGTRKASDFTIQVTGTAAAPASFPGSETGTIVNLKAGPYAVDEVAAAGYVKTLSPECSGTIAVGEIKTCTVTNQYAAATLVVVKKVHNLHGGTKTPADFTLTVAGTNPSPASFAGADAPGTTVTLKAGSYSVDEVAVAGYVKSLSADCAGTIAAGQTKTCTVTNSDTPPSLTVIKKVVNDDGGAGVAADFTMQVTGTGVSSASFPGSASGTTVTLKAGSYSVDEVAVAGYAKTRSGDCAGTIAIGEARTCTITNDDIGPRLVVIKKVVNTRGGTKTPADFTLTVTGSGANPATFPGADAPGTTVTLKAGAYSVDEVAVAGYAKARSADCAGTIAVGQTRTCTVTNSDVAPQVTVVKRVVNDNGGTATAGSFTMLVTGSSVSSPFFSGSEAGTTVTLDAGPYSVDEVAVAGYAKALSADCAGTIAVGQSKICTVTNDDVPPRLVVIKTVVNDNGGTALPAAFTMQVTGGGASPAAFPGAGGAGTTVALDVGPYSVSETGPRGYVGTFSADCAGSLALGQVKTCTVVNDDVAPRLTVVKRVVNDSGGTAAAADFTMLVTGVNVSAPSFPGSETGTTVTLNAGAYSVDEIAAFGYTMAPGAGCRGTIAVGQTRTCTITNNDPAPTPFNPQFCKDPATLAVMDPGSGRFPGNRGPDVVVDGRTHSIQAAVEHVTDVNEDGYLIVGLVARDKGQPGGSAKQSIEVSKKYGKPIAIVSCAVVLSDPERCDGIPAVYVRASATSPAHPAGSGVTVYIHGIATEHSNSSPGYLIEGDGRFVDEADVRDSMIGMKIVGHGNTVKNARVSDNLVDGITVQGNGNVIDGAHVVDNAGGEGIWVRGNGNTVLRSTAGGQGKGNGANGIAVAGQGNVVRNNQAYGNGGHGIHVSGGTAASPNVVRANVAGAPYRGNVGSGIVVAGTGNGGANVVEVVSNTTQSNGTYGIRVTGTGHQLKNNASGGTGAANALCAYSVAPGNINATGNTSGPKTIPGANGSAFPTGCK